MTIGWIFWRQGNKLFKKWKRSRAVIVRNNYTPNEFALFKGNDPADDETGTYHAVVEFTTDTGEVITKQLDFGGYPPIIVGQWITVIYDPADPFNFVTSPQMNLQIIPRLLVAIGLIGILVSVADLFGVISVIPD